MRVKIVFLLQLVLFIVGCDALVSPPEPKAPVGVTYKIPEGGSFYNCEDNRQLDTTSQIDYVSYSFNHQQQWNHKNLGASDIYHLLQFGYLKNSKIDEDIGVYEQGEAVWKKATGKGVIIANVDNSYDYKNPLLCGNLQQDMSGKMSSGDGHLEIGSVARTASTRQHRTHGTRVAGIYAAKELNAPNFDESIKGLAFDAKVAAFTFDQGFISTFDALTLGDFIIDKGIDVINASFGPVDDGELNNHVFVRSGMVEKLTKHGRKGKGTVIVVASGNGGATTYRPAFQGFLPANSFLPYKHYYALEDSNYDSLSSHPFVISACAVGPDGGKLDYSETGANILVCAPSHRILTTDAISQSQDEASSDLYYLMRGSSAAAPHISGIVALLLEVRPDLTYRDVRAILASSARKNDTSSPYWQEAGAKIGVPGKNYAVHDLYGFGVAQANKAVQLARGWELLPKQKTCRLYAFPNEPITDASHGSSSGITTSSLGQEVRIKLDASNCEIKTVETTQVLVRIKDGLVGDYLITQESPSGSKSILSRPHLCKDGFVYKNCESVFSLGWVFSSVRHLGESAQGDWEFVVQDGYFNSRTGTLMEVDLTIQGY